MKFTLILATLGRSIEVAKFFESLKNQSFHDFDVVLVDQNTDNRVFKIYNQYRKFFSIDYIRTNQKGLSRARNLGLCRKLGEFVVFPDDDCCYPVDTLQKVNNLFLETNIDIISGQPVDFKENPLINNYLKKDAEVNLNNVWNAGISFTLFFRKKVIEDVGCFDEMLGVGSNTFYGSGEETDYLIRALKQHYRMKFVSDVKIYHPRKTSTGDKKELGRALLYGGGLGYVLKKHHYSKKKQLLCLIRPLGGTILAILQLDFHLAMFRINTLRGRIRGLNAKIDK